MAASSQATESTLLSRILRALRPSHEHSAFSATVLLMAAIMLSRVIGYLREAYIAYAFGAGPATDAYVAAFTIPDWLNYMLAGGTASITFISIITRLTSQGREDEADRAFSVTVTVMTAILSAGIILMTIFARPVERLIFPRFTPEQLDLCVHLTRILLPAQLFFYVGGIVSAVLLSRRLFLIPALAPLVYNVFIIVGGIVGAKHFGVASLAVGALVGAFLGPFLINAIGASQAGTRYKFIFDTKNPAFREWLRLSIPLMLGVSLVSADDWILRYFASGAAGDITRLNYAKRLFAVPIAVLGQAAGQASLPFFARLFGEGKREQFSKLVSGSVFRISALSFLASAWMCVTALPTIDIVYRHGRFSVADSHETSVYFFWFGLSLAFWAAQALYARAYYAAGNTLTPMVASTLVTLASLPVYSALFHSLGTPGLAIASDIGIFANTVVLAVILHRGNMVRAEDLPWGELGKALGTAVIAALAAWGASRVNFGVGRKAELMSIALSTLTWAAAVAGGLWITRSRLWQELRRKKEAPVETGASPTAVEP